MTIKLYDKFNGYYCDACGKRLREDGENFNYCPYCGVSFELKCMEE